MSDNTYYLVLASSSQIKPITDGIRLLFVLCVLHFQLPHTYSQNNDLIHSIDSINYYTNSKIQTGLTSELIYDKQYENFEVLLKLDEAALRSIVFDITKSELVRLLAFKSLIHKQKSVNRDLCFIHFANDIKEAEVNVFLNHCQGYKCIDLEKIIIQTIVDYENNNNFQYDLSCLTVDWYSAIMNYREIDSRNKQLIRSMPIKGAGHNDFR